MLVSLLGPVASTNLNMPRGILAILRRWLEIELSCPHICVPRQLLHFEQWRAIFQRVRYRRLSQRMHPYPPAPESLDLDPGAPGVLLHDRQDRASVKALVDETFSILCDRPE